MKYSFLSAIASLGLAVAPWSAGQAQAPQAQTPKFPLGAYISNPDAWDTGAEQQFRTGMKSFIQTMGVAPTLIVAYVDYTQTVDQWPGNAGFQAYSNQQSPMAAKLTPVVGIPLFSIAPGHDTPDNQYKSFIAGTYDPYIKGVVDQWATHGAARVIYRLGWEMNINGPTYVGDDAQSQSDWVLAFQHIATVIRAEAAVYHQPVQIVWNPNVTNYTSVDAVHNLYPGDAYVDVIGADMYADIWPYSDGGSPAKYHDWKTGGETTNFSAWLYSIPNRRHYWSYPAASEWNPNGSSPWSTYLSDIISLAESHGKPFAMCETGAGNSDGGHDLKDDGAFPSWLAETLTTEVRKHHLSVAFVNVWDSNGGGSFEFSFPSDGKPHEAGTWALRFGVKSQ